jgi:hypothetical protein
MQHQLKSKSLKTLKVVHLMFVALWVGGNVSAVLLSFLATSATTDAVLGIYLAMEVVDYWIIIPGSSGCLITGIVYGIWTKWGFFKHPWIIVKWVVMIVQMIAGAAFLGQAVAANVALLEGAGPAVATGQSFKTNESLIQTLGIIQSVLLLFLIWISTFKPGRPRRPKRV